MTNQHLTKIGAGSFSNSVSGSPQDRAIASSESEPMRVLQREAVARQEACVREKALVHQMEELIHDQKETLRKLFAWREDAANRIARLTPRQRQIMNLVLAGHPNKNIAVDLGISERTVETHRAAIKRGTGTKSLPALTRLALAAALNDIPEMKFRNWTNHLEVNNETNCFNGCPLGLAFRALRVR